MRRRITMCALCVCMLGIFLHTGYEDQRALAAQESCSMLAAALSSQRTVLMNCRIPLGSLLTADSWYSEELYRVTLFRTASESILYVTDPETEDTVLQELSVSLPGEVLGIESFFTFKYHKTADSGSATDNDDRTGGSTAQDNSAGADGSNGAAVCVGVWDVVLSCSGGSSGETHKFLYLWDQEKQAYDEEPVELPEDYVPESHALRILLFSRTGREGSTVRKTLYQVCPETKDIVPLRSYALNREKETLEIRDELRHRVLFSGSVQLNNEGDPENQAYFDFFFGNFSYVTKPWKPDPNIGYEEGIPVFFEEPDEYGYHTVYYPDRETFLSEQGFSGQEPFYRYMNTWGDLEVELYYDTATETGCGFYYDYEFYPEQEQIITGYVFQGIEEQPWEPYPPYALENRYGETGKEYLGDGEVLSYEEDCRYRADGRPEYFCASGLADFYRDEPEEDTFLELNFVYRDDGSLACREYSHNSWIWGSSYGSGTYLYDEKERLIYENLYVTHGGQSFYYIYEDGSDKPIYALMLDNCGSWGSGLYTVK